MSHSKGLISATSVLAANGKSFSFAGKFLDSSTLNACARLYRFCRYMDDLIDESEDAVESQCQLSRIQHEIVSRQSATPLVADFIELSEEFQLDPAVTKELLKGFETDLSLVRIQSQEELLRYCYRVAGTVGLHMCSIFEVRDKVARAHAIDLGIAMQLTNICRDVLEDAEQGRRYLPASMVTDLQPEQLEKPTIDQALQIKSTVAYLLKIAETYYESGASGYQHLPFRARVSIAIAARVYRGIGDIIENCNHDVWAGRAVTTLPTKYKLAASAVFSLIKGRHLPTEHTSDLHLSLEGLPDADRIE